MQRHVEEGMRPPSRSRYQRSPPSPASSTRRRRTGPCPACCSIASSQSGKNHAAMCLTASSRKPSTPVVSRYHLPQSVTSLRTSWLWKSRSRPSGRRSCRAQAPPRRRTLALEEVDRVPLVGRPRRSRRRRSALALHSNARVLAPAAREVEVGVGLESRAGCRGRSCGRPAGNGVASTSSAASPPMRWFRTRRRRRPGVPPSCRALTAARYSSFVPYLVRTLPFWSNSPRSYMS